MMNVLPVMVATASMISVSSASRNAGVIVACAAAAAACAVCWAQPGALLSKHANVAASRRERFHAALLVFSSVMDGSLTGTGGGRSFWKGVGPSFDGLRVGIGPRLASRRRAARRIGQRQLGHVQRQLLRLAVALDGHGDPIGAAH